VYRSIIGLQGENMKATVSPRHYIDCCYYEMIIDKFLLLILPSFNENSFEYRSRRRVICIVYTHGKNVILLNLKKNENCKVSSYDAM